MILATWARKVSPQHRKTKMFLKHHPTFTMLFFLIILILDSVLLRDTAVCFLHIQDIGTHLYDPNTHETPPEDELESCESPAKEAS